MARPSEAAASSASVGSKRPREPEVEAAAAGVTAAVAAPMRAPHPAVALRAAVDRAYAALQNVPHGEKGTRKADLKAARRALKAMTG